MSGGILKLSQRVGPLQKKLEEAYSKSGRRTNSVAKISLGFIGWGESELKDFYDLKEQQIHAVKTAYSDRSLTISLFNDGRDENWSEVLTQLEPRELSKRLTAHTHDPFDFIGVDFTGAQEHWSTYEREEFWVMEAFRRLNYLIFFAFEDSTVVYSDDLNLLFIFHSVEIEPKIGRYKVLKVVRWALFLSDFT